MDYAVEITDLSKTYGNTRALDRVSLTVRPGEMVALIGPSGAGKSTLLKHLNGLVVSDRCDNSVRVLDRTVQRCGDVNTRVRSIRSQIGFIFQQFNLVGRLSLLTNVLIGSVSRVPNWRTMFRYFTYREKKYAMAALARVGMAEFAAQRASTLSGGQQQRAAIARALVQEARMILADEPIASLDPESARRVMQALTDINREDGVTVLVSLHQVDFAMRFCERCVGMKDGRVMFDGPVEQISTELLRDLYGSEFSDLQEGLDMFAHISEKNRTQNTNRRSSGAAGERDRNDRASVA